MNKKSGGFCDCTEPLYIDRDGVEFCSSFDCKFFDKEGAKKYWFPNGSAQGTPKPKKKK